MNEKSFHFSDYLRLIYIDYWVPELLPWLYNIRAIKSEILIQKNITLIKPSSPSSRPAQPASLYLFLDITRIFNSSHIFINSISFQSPPCPRTQYPGSFALSSSTLLSNFHPWLCCRKGSLPGPKSGLLSNSEINCLRKHTCWWSRRLYWEGAPGWRAEG